VYVYVYVYVYLCVCVFVCVCLYKYLYGGKVFCVCHGANGLTLSLQHNTRSLILVCPALSLWRCVVWSRRMRGYAR